MAAIRESAAKRADARADLFAKGDLGQANTRAELRAAALRGVGATVKGIKEKEGAGTITEARAHQIVAEGIASIRGAIADFGSNLLSPGAGDSLGQTATHAREQTILLRDLNRNVQQLTQGVSHPNTRYAHSELAAVMEVGAL